MGSLFLCHQNGLHGRDPHIRVGPLTAEIVAPVLEQKPVPRSKKPKAKSCKPNRRPAGWLAKMVYRASADEIEAILSF